jgi:site-specific DNA recombinase
VDIQDTLEQALQLAQDCQQAYILAGPKLRRLFNQAFFEKLYLDDEGNVRSVLAEPFAGLLGDALAAEAEAVLAQRAKEADTGTPAQGIVVTPDGEMTEAATTGDGFSYQAAPIRDSSFVTGLNERRLVGREGLEPPTPCASCKCSSQLS